MKGVHRYWYLLVWAILVKKSTNIFVYLKSFDWRIFKTFGILGIQFSENFILQIEIQGGPEKSFYLILYIFLIVNMIKP